ncbi:MAG: hypothetical protein HOD98_08515 [Candidatus Marinimicrobia bacterium]|nr:hypothetical protein [Candidatus Neomarinimicrobiota bacterium]
MERSMKKLHHYLGVELNQQTWTLLENKKREPQDDNRMIAFAKASLYHWERSSEFQPLNQQRGEWMISHVYSVLGKSENALSHAKKCWNLTESLKLEGFDLAYAYEALARAYGAAGNSIKLNEYFLKAKSSAEKIDEKDNRDLFISDLNSEPWFECLKLDE